jgi:hypothetical protein
MGLENALQEIISKRNIRRVGGVCTYQEMYDNLPADDQKALNQAWEKGYPVSLIVQALRADGHRCSADTIRLHRSGTCRCPKE